jgi:hypothetical protein
MFVTATAVKWVWRLLRIASGAVVLIAGLIGAKALPLGVAMWVVEWLRQPFLFVPLIMIGTVLISLDVLTWIGKRRERRTATPQATWPLREFVRYLATKAEVAYEFDDYRVWDRELERGIVDDFANETRPLAVWGRASRSGQENGDLGPMELLRPAYWSKNRLDWHSCLAADYPRSAQT